jgi:flagellar assembly protein FliH
LSSGGLLKSGWVYVNPENTRIIDSNKKAEEKLKEIAIELAKKCGDESDFADGFTNGIKAVDVSELVGENDVVIGGTKEDVENAQQAKAKEELLEEAKAQIATMKQEATTQIEQERVKAIEDGKNEGYQQGLEQGKAEGFEQGHQEGLEAVAQLKDELLAQNEETKAKLEGEYQQKLREVEPKFIDTLTGIYEHIFHVSFKNSRDLIVYLIQNTMRNVEGAGTYLIHVSKEDFPFASMQKKELVKGTNINLDNVEILEDATLSKNECMIETGNGVFDCSLGTQLEALNEQLRLLSYEP